MSKATMLIGAVVVVGAGLIGMLFGKSLSQEVFSLFKPDAENLQAALIKGFNQAAATANKQGPVMVDKETRWDSSSVGPGARMNYFYSFPNYAAADLDKDVILNDVSAMVSKDVCTHAEMQPTLKMGAIYSYVYKGNDDVEIARFEVDAQRCAQHW